VSREPDRVECKDRRGTVVPKVNMAVTIRLRREGTKNRSYYRVVVADKRSPRDGKFIEAIGNYDPNATGDNFQLNLGRVDYWVRNGAQPSSTVASMILKARKKAAAVPTQ
jgi:small subunit ribosomal protein S16